VQAYLAAGAREAWVAYSESRRVEWFGAEGALSASAFSVDLSALFD
jgi:hypothetical protein